MKYTIYSPVDGKKVSFIEDSIQDAIDHFFMKFPVMHLLWKAGEDMPTIVGIYYSGTDESAEIEIDLPLGVRVTYRVVGS